MDVPLLAANLGATQISVNLGSGGTGNFKVDQAIVAPTGAAASVVHVLLPRIVGGGAILTPQGHLHVVGTKAQVVHLTGIDRHRLVKGQGLPTLGGSRVVAVQGSGTQHLALAVVVGADGGGQSTHAGLHTDVCLHAIHGVGGGSKRCPDVVVLDVPVLSAQLGATEIFGRGFISVDDEIGQVVGAPTTAATAGVYVGTIFVGVGGSGTPQGDLAAVTAQAQVVGLTLRHRYGLVEGQGLPAFRVFGDRERNRCFAQRLTFTVHVGADGGTQSAGACHALHVHTDRLDYVGVGRECAVHIIAQDIPLFRANIRTT